MMIKWILKVFAFEACVVPKMLKLFCVNFIFPREAMFAQHYLQCMHKGGLGGDILQGQQGCLVGGGMVGREILLQGQQGCFVGGEVL